MDTGDSLEDLSRIMDGERESENFMLLTQLDYMKRGKGEDENKI